MCALLVDTSKWEGLLCKQLLSNRWRFTIPTKDNLYNPQRATFRLKNIGSSLTRLYLLAQIHFSKRQVPLIGRNFPSIFFLCCLQRAKLQAKLNNSTSNIFALHVYKKCV